MRVGYWFDHSFLRPRRQYCNNSPSRSRYDHRKSVGIIPNCLFTIEAIDSVRFPFGLIPLCPFASFIIVRSVSESNGDIPFGLNLVNKDRSSFGSPIKPGFSHGCCQSLRSWLGPPGPLQLRQVTRRLAHARRTPPGS